MIQLTRLNTQPLMVNSDLIKFVECAPDTVLTLVSGEKVVVRESASVVLEKIIQFRRAILDGLTLKPAEEPVAAASASGASAESKEENG